jgi:hypothetical protein
VASLPDEMKSTWTGMSGKPVPKATGHDWRRRTLDQDTRENKHAAFVRIHPTSRSVVPASVPDLDFLDF